jgi:glycosyltransferase involved in cell wall biosynthesis
MKLKIVYLISTLRRCGPTNLLYDVVVHLEPTLYEVYIITLSPERQHSRLDDFLKLPSVKNIQQATDGDAHLMRLGKFVSAICRKINPNVVHAQGFRADLISSIYLKKYKQVYNIQNYPYDDYVMQFGFKGYIMAFSTIFLLRKSSYMTVCSNYIANLLQPKFKQPLIVVQNAVEFGFLPINDLQKNEIKTKLNIDNHKKVFVFAGNLIKRKNPLVLIEAFNLLKQVEENFVLLVLGDGYLMDESKKMANNNFNIKFVGAVEDVSIYYQISDYYITASLSEGMPVSVLESLNHGLPVILSDIPQHAEIVQELNSAGLLFEKTNAQDLAQAIRNFVKNDYSQQRSFAIDSIKNKFNAKRMADDFKVIYNS